MDCSPPGSSACGDSPGKNTGVGCHALLQGIFLTQVSNPDLPHYKQILYHLSHQGRPRILEWIAYPFSGGSSQPKDRTGVSCIAGRFFTSYQGGPNIAVAYPNYTWCVFVCFLALFTEVSAMDTHAEITAALGYCSCTFFLQLDFLYFIDLIAYLHEGSPKVQYSRGKKK